MDRRLIRRRLTGRDPLLYRVEEEGVRVVGPCLDERVEQRREQILEPIAVLEEVRALGRGDGHGEHEER